MSYQLPADVEHLVREQMATGSYTSADDVLRAALKLLGEFTHSPAEIDEEYRLTLAAVREGLADVQAGRARPLRDIIAEERGQ